MKEQFPPKFMTVDEYIAASSPEAKKLLLELRDIIRKHAPGAEELISYNMPALKIHRRILVYYAAHSEHIGFYPADAKILVLFKNDLRDYATSKGTIRFPFGRPLPAGLVGKIIVQRVADNRLKAGKRV
jgi:uncharacterized protein YdhG (YjbR/CyaY superfamily)